MERVQFVITDNTSNGDAAQVSGVVIDTHKGVLDLILELSVLFDVVIDNNRILICDKE